MTTDLNDYRSAKAEPIPTTVLKQIRARVAADKERDAQPAKNSAKKP